ncbi:hypothetical protein F6V30_09720 [Oryzomonas sagensis]|uniref:Glycosyltransferase WbsX n=1 Tax=Oryzomonas sagensis TaxID=2603857 RepID=A0ABQ6TP60_9BACT|nr:glycoside hydrolase family 99-like domain-containing protein [Oryzomonas sagensis]KAB0670418.1 hypothetical protein F6V30_09720 [Oryzomonas sagensis]
MKRIQFVALLVLLCGTSAGSYAQNYSIGVYYYPGWRSDYINWKDIKGLPGSRSPGKPWPERVPLLGYYPEEQQWVAERHIDLATKYGINFFVYDWYWDGSSPQFNHAINNYLHAKNRSKLQFSILWDNAFATLTTLTQYDNMVSYWINNYFNQPTFYQIDGKPAVFIFSNPQLLLYATTLGTSVQSLLQRADSMAKSRGYNGIYFVATINDMPATSLENQLSGRGFSAYTGWNYAMARGALVDDYSTMVDGYLAYYTAAANTAKILPYLVPASPGYDERPWHGATSIVRNNPTPDKFTRMLTGAKALLDQQQNTAKILLIEAWNEFGEGSVIEPTNKWGTSYLETIRHVFVPSAAAKKRPK